MSKYVLTNGEKQILKVLKNEITYAQDIPSLDAANSTLDARIAESEALLRSLNYRGQIQKPVTSKSTIQIRPGDIRTFDELLSEANRKNPSEIRFEDIFTKNELIANAEYIRRINDEFNSIHKLDKVDVLIPAVAGILSGAIDCVFGGFIRTASGRSIPGSMTQYVNKLFDKALPPDRIKRLEDLAKVPYDALNYDNKGNIIVNEIVDGLSPVFHHQVSLGHDPILGFIFGVLDMMRGTVTTLDFNGKFLIQAADGFSDRKAQNLFQAIATVFLHMLSDINGSSSARNGGMGLPVPFMALFNKMQFGKVAGHDTIEELVKSMFYEGYDFRHFCAMSIPVMITEVIVRISYFAKRLHEGCSFKDAIPVGSDHIKKPKLGTMLFIAHSASTAINAGKVLFTRNPLDINYAQWLSFARYSVRQLKWVIFEKPALREKYVLGIINSEWDELTSSIDNLWGELTGGTVVGYV